MPIWFIATIIILFAWLLYETDFMRMCLLVGDRVKPKYARYCAYNVMGNKKPNWSTTTLHKGGNLPEGYSPNGEPEYIISLNPGIDNVLCSWEWLDKHCADLVDYQPEVSMHIAGVRYQMTIKQPTIIKDIMRVNRISRKEKLAYAQ